MAFTTVYTNPRGRSFPAAYVKVASATCSMQQCMVAFAVWESAAARQEYPALPDSYLDRSYDTVPELASDNPIDYAYQLAQASGEWPDATWNV